MTATLAASPTEAAFTELLAGVLRVENVPADGHFFDDLGADSLLMAQFCARVRKRGDLPPVSIKDVYEHPTIRSLATSLGDDATAAAPAEAPVQAPVEPARPAGTPRYVLCGALQLLVVLGYLYGAALGIVAGAGWISAGSGAIDVYLRTVAFGAAAFTVMCVLPILAKWALVGRFGPRPVRVWSLPYLRFWIVKTLIQRNPLVLFAGTPLYVLYLRALGARIGRDALILSHRAPVCTDLLSVGDRTVLHKDTFFTCYRAEDGLIRPGPVTLGSDVVVGEGAVLDTATSMGDGAQLGHASSLQAGQSVPAGERRHGFAAEERSEVDYRGVEAAAMGRPRKAAYSVLQLLAVVALRLPVAVGGVALMTATVPRPALASVLFFGSILLGLVVVVTVPRVLNRFIEPGRVYRLYGFHHAVHRAIERLSNVPFFPRLLGDSSYIVPYLRWLGYDLSKVQQTGSNFGLEVKHENPFLCTIGSGTMVADGLSMVNAEFSSTSFRVSRVTIGPRSFLGNYIVYPPQGRTGDNCLIATKAMVPLDGEVREDTGLLGSPSFEIPRSVDRDSRFDHLQHGDELRRRLPAKNRHNAVSIGLYLVSWWSFWVAVTALGWLALDLHGSVGPIAIAVAGLLALGLRVVHFGVIERMSTGFRDLEPRYCSIYDPHFWWHERFWKLAWQPLILDGTPFKNLSWRLQGVRLGKQVFDDGCAIVEKTLVTIGDRCTLGVRSIVQPHSQESGAFKSDRIEIGAGCTLGIGSLVHYGATMGEGAVLAPDSFLMKGAEVPSLARWAGNPAASRPPA